MMRNAAIPCLVLATLWSAAAAAQAKPGAAPSNAQPVDLTGEPPPLPPPDPLPPLPPTTPPVVEEPQPGALPPPPPPPPNTPTPGGYPSAQGQHAGNGGPPPPPARPRRKRPYGVHLHNGFYLRLGIGVGGANENITESDDMGNPGVTELTSLSFPAEIALGGTLGAGFVLGLGINTGSIAKKDRSMLPMPAEKAGDHHGATFFVTGPMFDWYIDPKEGFHVQGMIGASGLTLAATSESNYAPGGWGFSLGGGKEWWVGDEGSMGVIARVDVGNLVYDEDNTTRHFEHNVIQAGVLATFTYH